MLLCYAETKVSNWVHAVEVLTRIVVQNPQSAYTRLTMLLQAEWQYLRRAVTGVKAHLQPTKDAIWSKFIPVLMGMTEAEVNNDMRALFTNSVKQGDLNLRDPVAATPRHRQSSLERSAVLIKSHTFTRY